MDKFSSLFKKEHTGELILVILFIIYLVMGYNTPEPLANLIDSLGGKIVIFIVVIYLFLNTNSILAVLALFVAFELIRRSSSTEMQPEEIQRYMPSEEKKTSQFTAFNQFPYTLEQEVVNKMAPILKTGSSLHPPTYKPLLDNLYDASPLNVPN
jgi:hypothetical protein